MFHSMNDREAVNKLRRAGFKHIEIERIIQFRKNFTYNEMDQTPDEHRRMEFMRWLFQTGKLTDFVN